MKLITITFLALGIAIPTIAQAASTVSGARNFTPVPGTKLARMCTTTCTGSYGYRTCNTYCY